MWLCHNTYGKWHFLYVGFKLRNYQHNQWYPAPHDWSITCREILLVLLASFETHRSLWKFLEVSKALLIFYKTFHTNRRNYGRKYCLKDDRFSSKLSDITCSGRCERRQMNRHHLNTQGLSDQEMKMLADIIRHKCFLSQQQ